MLAVNIITKPIPNTYSFSEQLHLLQQTINVEPICQFRTKSFHHQNLGMSYN